MKKFYRALVYILPTVLFFSYYPVIKLGSLESMNLELSLPLIWLVVFDIVSGFLLIKTHPKISKKILPLFITPIFMTLSIFWSKNQLRGILTVGILWLIIFAAINFIYLYKNTTKDAPNFSNNMVKTLFVSTIFVCIWCWIQCILDINGVGQNQSLMCNGCTTKMFGFPHPNGFAIEPQFMGNLLLFPTLLAIYLLAKNNKKISLWILSFFFSSTLFLTFSRGAIYSFAVALIFLIAFLIARKKSIKPLNLIIAPLVAFIFTLNFQGVFAEVSKTSETYISGISKALSHLSLGIIDLKISAPSEPNVNDESDNYEPSQEFKEQAVFDGYIEESTTVRMDLTKSALEVWSSNPKNLLFGVGIGSAGTDLYENQKVGTPKEIVQNQYISLLLEIGLIGIAGVLLSLFFIFRYAKNTIGIFTYTAIIAYGISLFFFAGLPNALHVYLLPAFFGKHKSIIKQKI